MSVLEPDRSTPRSSQTLLAVTGEQRVTLREIRPAIFFDRDGTLIRDVGYIKNLEDVELVPHAVNAVRRMNYQLWPVIVVTNQSGIARGFLTEDDYDRARERLDDLVQERGAYITAQYHCPHHPDYTGPCECRKPGTALFEQAMAEHAINPALSVFVGDRWRDIVPARHYGARGILVPNEGTPAEEIEKARTEMEVAHTLTDVVHLILQV
ncbi:MAG: D-glycero-alpha-D-manno-heptose-1,7-bisphosphate 7-phosphatase [Gemmatimonadales bacterium]|jgi:histidinol-phosphate phosphatase family protein